MLDFLQQWGALGLFWGAFLAATVVPFSSDALFCGLVLAGTNPIECFVAATLGNWLGGLTTFGIGWLGKWEWIERWFHVSPEKLQRQKQRVDKWGPPLALFTWLPLLGDVLALALGFYKVKPLRCALFMLVGKGARFLVWLFLMGKMMG